MGNWELSHVVKPTKNYPQFTFIILYPILSSGVISSHDQQASFQLLQCHLCLAGPTKISCRCSLQPTQTVWFFRRRHLLPVAKHTGTPRRPSNQFKKKYFTSCDIHHDIYTFSYWQIFWHSFWHFFWHSIWHIFWHSFWHSMWHIFWYSFWHILWHSEHSFWHILWYSFWHIFWHSFWHSIWHIF